MDSLPDLSSTRKSGFTPEPDSGDVHKEPRHNVGSQELRRSQVLGGLRSERAKGEAEDDDESGAGADKEGVDVYAYGLQQPLFYWM